MNPYDMTDGGLSAFGMGESASFSGVNPEFFKAAIAASAKITDPGGTIDSTVATVNDAYAKQQTAMQQQAQAIGKEAEHRANAAGATNAVTLAHQAKINNILEVAQLDFADPENRDTLTSRLIDNVFAQKSSLDSMGQEIQARQSVGIFDNPLMWMVNQTRLPGMVGEYNAKAGQLNRDIEQYNTVTSIAATGITMSQAAEVDTLQKAQQQTAAADAQKAAAVKSEIDARLQGESIRNALTKLQLEDMRVTHAEKLANLSRQREAAASRALAKASQEELLQAEVDQVNNWYATIGSKTRFTVPSWLKSADGFRKKKLADSSSGIIAPTPYEAITHITQEGDKMKIYEEGSMATVSWMHAFQKAAGDKVNDTVKKQPEGSKPIDAEGLMKQEMDGMTLRVENDSLNMLEAAPYNPRKIDYEAMANINANIAKNAPGLAGKINFGPKNIVLDYIKEHGPNGALTKGPVKEDKLMAYIIEQVDAGKISAVDADAQLGKFYDVASTMTAELVKYPLFGIPYTGTYQVKIPASGFFDKVTSTYPRTEGTIDLMNSSSRINYLTKAIAQRRMQRSTASDPLTGYQFLLPTDMYAKP